MTSLNVQYIVCFEISTRGLYSRKKYKYRVLFQKREGIRSWFPALPTFTYLPCIDMGFAIPLCWSYYILGWSNFGAWTLGGMKERVTYLVRVFFRLLNRIYFVQIIGSWNSFFCVVFALLYLISFGGGRGSGEWMYHNLHCCCLVSQRIFRPCQWLHVSVQQLTILATCSNWVFYCLSTYEIFHQREFLLLHGTHL